MNSSAHVYLGLVLSMPALACAQQGAPRGDAASAGCFTGRPVSGPQLEQLLKQNEKKRDSALARELYGLQLTERLSNRKLDSLKQALPGEKSRAALVAVADASAFRLPPAAEIPAAPAPDAAEQDRIVARAMDYFGQTLTRLPDFSATRTTVRYEDTGEDPGRPGMSIYTGDSLHLAGSSSASVVYRDGQEFVDGAIGNRIKPGLKEGGLTTSGTFGAILGTVMLDAAHGKMNFTRWEQGPDVLEAVFRFVVPKESSHYLVAYATPGAIKPGSSLEKPAAYHGEAVFDAVTGAILRVAIEADLDPDAALLCSDVMVEYGTVEIGGKAYICPLKSVSLSRGHSVLPGEKDRPGSPSGPAITRLNDVAFVNYHMFRSEVRVIPVDAPPGSDH